MQAKMSNNGEGRLASPIDADDTTLYLQTGQGALFRPLSAGEWMPLTIIDSTGNFEIVKASALAGDTFTIERHQEGTTARAFSAGDRVQNRLTAAVLDELSFRMPAGAILPFSMSAAPTGWLIANGAAVSRSAYASLFAAIGTLYGAGDGVTTFNLPDLRGEFIRGADQGRGVDAGRTVGSVQADELRAHSHTVRTYQGPTGMGVANTGASAPGPYDVAGGALPTGGAETRPRNVALLYCIKF